MSTEVLEKTNAVDFQPLTEFIQDENLDIIHEKNMSAERLARLVFIIGNRIRFCSHNNVAEYNFLMSGKLWEVKVNNNYKGFVSVTDEDGCTGVSYTEYKPFWSDDEDGYFTGYCSLAQMINEAWYLCTTKGDNLGAGVI